ncbi:hypothetical protein [Rhodopirellula sp. SWK7]|uniref:hypothetical protein n=1 Tax=Rhodopirellula sp. SWK7 TaxID=595460 RepID=UPI0002BFAE22|nr:hypothetical protein [Rhodopirellula sp. SWK7]EMI43831.1 hypothetical protein RRSWK_03681 [Rhodopirellula sp. SWK7]
MHERTTRAIARWLFVGCCAVPTVLTMFAILVTWTPWYDNRARHALEDHVALLTGLHVEIGDFERADPSTWRLSDVRLADPETLRTVATVRTVCWISQSDSTVIRLSQPEIRVETLDQVATLVHHRFLCRPDQTRVPVRIAADDVTLRGQSTAQTLQDFDAYLETRDDVVWATVRCIPAGQRPDSEGVQIEVTRDRSVSPPMTSWSLQTGEMRMPLAVMADYYPFVNRLGADATFDGTFSASRQDGVAADAWSISTVGHFRNVDLAQLTQELPHRVTGRGDVAIDRCQLERDGSVNVAGQLIVNEGWMSASILPRLAEDLGCELTVPIQDDFAFDALALRFDLYAAQLKVEGVCRELSGRQWLPSDVVVSAGGQPIVLSRGGWLPATNLARLIAPAHSVTIPISHQTTGLLEILRPPRHALPGSVHPQTPMDENAEPAARIGRLQPWRDQSEPISQPR